MENVREIRKRKTILVKGNAKPNGSIVIFPCEELTNNGYGFFIENRTDYNVYYSIDERISDISSMFLVRPYEWAYDNLTVTKYLCFYSVNDLTNTDGIFVSIFRYPFDDSSIIKDNEVKIENVNEIVSKINTGNIKSTNPYSNRKIKEERSVVSNTKDVDVPNIILKEGDDDY